MVARGDKVAVPATVDSTTPDETHYEVSWDAGYDSIVPDSCVTSPNMRTASDGEPHKKGDRVKMTRSIGHARKGDEGKVKATRSGPHYVVSLSTGGSAVVGSDVPKYDPDNDNDTDTSGKPDTDALMTAAEMQEAMMGSRRRW